MPALHQVVVRPVVTEKSSAAYQTRKEYTFEVHPQANKYQIRAAIQALFPVTVTGVRTMQMRRHEVTRGRIRGTTNRWKRAMGALKAGVSVAVFGGWDEHRAFPADDGRPPLPLGVRVRRDHPRHAGEVAARADEEVGRAEQPGPPDLPASGR